MWGIRFAMGHGPEFGRLGPDIRVKAAFGSIEKLLYPRRNGRRDLADFVSEETGNRFYKLLHVAYWMYEPLCSNIQVGTGLSGVP